MFDCPKCSRKESMRNMFFFVKRSALEPHEGAITRMAECRKLLGLLATHESYVNLYMLTMVLCKSSYVHLLHVLFNGTFE